MKRREAQARSRRTAGGKPPQFETAPVSASRDRRDTILNAARTVLAKSGYEAATISDIVAAAGAAQGTFYLYFPSKLSLLEALSNQMFSELTSGARAAAESARTLEEAVRAVVQTAFDQARAFADIHAILSSPGAASEMRQGRERLTAPFVSFFVAFIQEWQRRGAADASIDAEITGPILAALVGQSACPAAAQRDPRSRVAAVTRIVQRALESRP